MILLTDRHSRENGNPKAMCSCSYSIKIPRQAGNDGFSIGDSHDISSLANRHSRKNGNPKAMCSYSYSITIPRQAGNDDFLRMFYW